MSYHFNFLFSKWSAKNVKNPSLFQNTYVPRYWIYKSYLVKQRMSSSVVPSLLTGQSYDMEEDTRRTLFPSLMLSLENPSPLIRILVSPHRLPWLGVIEFTKLPLIESKSLVSYIIMYM